MNNIFLTSGMRLVMLTGLVVLNACSGMDADLNVGKKAKAAGDYALADHHLRPLAEFGISEAQYEYALMIIKTKEAPYPTQEAYDRARTYLMAVEGDEKPAAQFELARVYQRGIGVKPDLRAAKDYYKLAGDLGNQRAYFELAQILEKEKDFVNAEGLYKHAFYNQYERAALNIGRMHEKGLGRPKDVVHALAWYMVAQRHNIPKANEAIKRVSKSLDSIAVARATEISTGLENNENN